MSSIDAFRFLAAAPSSSSSNLRSIIFSCNSLVINLSRYRALRCQCAKAAKTDSHDQRGLNYNNTSNIHVLCSGVVLRPLTSSPAIVAKSASVDVIKEMSPDLEDATGRITRLQNGSDVRGIALDGGEGREVDLTPPAVFCIAEAFGEWVASCWGKPATELRISLGRDPRISGPSLLSAAAGGLRNAGCSVYDMGLATTPACFMSTVLPGFAYDGSIMLTASHLPYTRNGLKFFTPGGGLNVVDVERICNNAASKYVNYEKMGTITATTDGNLVIEKADFMPIYAEHLRNIIKREVNRPTDYHRPLQGFKIVVNAGNGSGGFFAWDVLEKLGADIIGSLNLEPDGMFPNHTPNPENKVAMAVSAAAVLEQKADLGVVFDTDVDRSGVIDPDGNPINGDRLIALMAAIILKEHPGTTIVTDARTSEGLNRFITQRGGHHCLYRVGYKNVINKGVELNNSGIETHLMMETSGHGALKENYFLDDGAYMVVKIIIEMVRMERGSGISSLIQDLQDPKESIELRINILSKPKDVKHRGAKVIEAFRKCIVDGHLLGWQLDSCGENCWVTDGCLADFDDTMGPGWSQNEDYGPPPSIDAHMYRAKVLYKENGGSGWVHMRQSIHNPNIALNMQSSVKGGCHAMARVLLDRFLKRIGYAYDLDTSEIEKFVSEGKK